MNKKSKIIYSVFTLITVISFTSLTLWMVSDNAQENVGIQEANLVFNDKVRTEYLVNEEIDLTGIDVEINEELIPASDCEVKYDFTSAGDKVVTLSYVYENLTYEANYDVDVFMVRHIDVRNKEITQKRDGSWDFSKLIVWAELTSFATEFRKPDSFKDIEDTVIILNENQFDVEIKESSRKGYYNATISVGLVNSSFAFITNTDDPMVDSIDRILSFTNASGTSEKLTLFATESTSNFAPYTNASGNDSVDVNGIYVLEDAVGNKKQYRFSFFIRGWTSTFNSSSFNEGLVDYQGYGDDKDAYTVEVNGLKFYANAYEWHKAILNM